MNFEAVRANVKTSKLWAFMYPWKPRASKGRGREGKWEREKRGKGGERGRGRKKGGGWPSCCILQSIFIGSSSISRKVSYECLYTLGENNSTNTQNNIIC